MKRCPGCKKLKEDRDFPKDCRAKSGLGCYCKQCRQAYYKKNKSRIRTWQTQNKDKFQESYLHGKYNMTVADKIKLFNEQDGRCKFCNKPFINLSAACIDHNHRTGKVRWLLCRNCNLMLGNSFEDPIVLRKAASEIETNAHIGDV